MRWSDVDLDAGAVGPPRPAAPDLRPKVRWHMQQEGRLLTAHVDSSSMETDDIKSRAGRRGVRLLFVFFPLAWLPSSAKADTLRATPGR